MDEDERLSRLIGDIYDASLDPALWVGVLEQTCNYVGGVTAALHSHDVSRRNASFHFSWNDNPEYTASYIQQYANINPAIVPALIQTPIGDVSALSDFIPIEEYRATQLYKEWSAPQGYLDAVQATLDKSATSFASAAVIRHERQGPVDAGTRRRMRLLTPHFRRAVAIGKVIDLHKVEAAAFADALDGLAAAMLLVEASGRIVHGNVAALALLADGSVLRAVNGKLAAADAGVDRVLHDVFTNASEGDAAVDLKGAAVPLAARNGERFLAHVLPLTSGARRRAGVAYSAVAAVFVHKAALDLMHPLDAIAAAFKLTPSEMRVLMMIVNVGGVPEVAPVLGVSETTVKTHLQHIFDKTGTRRQADLVKLVAGYMGPLGG